MPNTRASTRAAAIEGFAAALTELRRAAGNPSFRVMSGRSKAISHTTLHEAAQGNRLPSWGTTVEFVRACGADPADYRERWEQANRVVGAPPPSRTGPPRVAAALGPVAPGRVDVPVQPAVAPRVPRPDEAATSPPAQAAVPPGPRSPLPGDGEPGRRSRARARDGWRRRPVLVGGAVVAALALVCAGVVAWSQLTQQSAAPRSRPHTATAGLAAARLAPSDCPVHQQNPPVAPPTHAGDHASFVADLTLPDCSHVRAGQTVKKVWRFKNAGTVPWTGYSLHRLDPQGREECQTITDVAIPATKPGGLVDVSVEVTVPPEPRFCFVRFKMMDGAGKVAFPGGRPVNFQVIVD